MFLQTLLATCCLLTQNEITLDNINQLKASDSKVTRIYIIRHGESAFNLKDANGIKYTSGKSLTLPLTENGLNQAASLGKKLDGKLPQNGQYIILSSTALRAQQTADKVFDELKLHYSIERGSSYDTLTEVGKGIWEGKPKDEAFDKSLKIWEDLSAKAKVTAPKVSTGETFKEYADMALKTLQQIADENSGKTIFVVSHYDATNAIALQLSDCKDKLSDEPGTPLPSMKLENCDMVLIELPKGEKIEKAKVQSHIHTEK